MENRPIPSLHPGAALAAGCVLAFLSAGVNACFLVRLGTSVSHLTGDVSKVAVDFAQAQAGVHTSVRQLLSATLGFVGGAGAAGFCIHHPELGVLRPYGRSIVSIGLFLGLAHFLLVGAPACAIALSAFACGLQNALSTHYKGIILRTTHLTGLLTDLGIQLGMRLRGHRTPSRKIAVPFFLVLSFFAGAAAGASLVISGYPNPLLLLSIAYVLCGIGWSVGTRLSDRARH